MVFIKGVFSMNNVQVLSKKLEQLSERDFIVVTTLIDTLLDPDWTMLSKEDMEDIEQAEEDFKNGIYFTHEEVWGD